MVSPLLHLLWLDHIFNDLVFLEHFGGHVARREVLLVERREVVHGAAEITGPGFLLEGNGGVGVQDSPALLAADGRVLHSLHMVQFLQRGHQG